MPCVRRRDLFWSVTFKSSIKFLQRRYNKHISFIVIDHRITRIYHYYLLYKYRQFPLILKYNNCILMPQLILSSDSNEGGYKFALRSTEPINRDLPTEYYGSVISFNAVSSLPITSQQTNHPTYVLMWTAYHRPSPVCLTNCQAELRV